MMLINAMLGYQTVIEEWRKIIERHNKATFEEIYYSEEYNYYFY